jgi:hypothetical protein
MRRLPISVPILIALAGPPAASAQKATEQFIPIGRSPGVSGKLSWIGEIVGTDLRRRTLTIGEAQGTRTVKITDKTRIFLDRSKLKQPNLTGSFADLKQGRRAEVKYEAGAQGHTADWVKVEIPSD